MRIAIASDHAGFALKEDVRKFLSTLSHEVLDLGAHDAVPSDYPDFAQAVGEAIMASSVERGILICGSGVGVCVAANKMPGVRAAICHDTYSAHQGVEHDDMNVLVMGSRIVGFALAYEITQQFLNATFQTLEPRFARRLEKLKAIEYFHMKETGKLSDCKDADAATIAAKGIIQCESEQTNSDTERGGSSDLPRRAECDH